MAIVPALTTELDACNMIIAILGEAPFNSLEGDLTQDMVAARQILTEVSREVQDRSWNFNTEEDFPMRPNTGGEIIFPVNVLSFEPSEYKHPTLKAAMRGSKLYDKENHTYIFSKTVYGKIVWMLSFDEIPEVARKYITVRAARIFQTRHVGSEELYQFHEQDEVMAHGALLDREGDVGGHNILNPFKNLMR
jgi:hypothetical protein